MMNTPNPITYFEDLSSLGINCPHEDAFAPDGNKIYYRYIHGGELKSECFLPTKIDPTKPLSKDFDECIGKSVSVFDHIDGLINGVFKLPHHKGKKRAIGLVKLCATDGLIKKTFGDNHYSWWRAKDFICESVTLQEIVIS